MKSKNQPSRGQGRAERGSMVDTLQTEFKGKTREEIEVALDQARKGRAAESSADDILEEVRVLLGAGSRG